MKTIYLENYIKAYEGHFKVDYDNRNDITLKKVEDAGVLLYLYISREFMKYSYKMAYEECKKILGV